MLVRKLASQGKSNLLPPIETVVARAVAHLKKCSAPTDRKVTLFDGVKVDAPLFTADNGLCFPQYEEDMTIEYDGAYPPFVLEGVYYPQVLKYLEVYPRVRARLGFCFTGLVAVHAVGRCGPRG